jgi:hypothetical protein
MNCPICHRYLFIQPTKVLMRSAACFPKIGQYEHTMCPSTCFSCEWENKQMNYYSLRQKIGQCEYLLSCERGTSYPTRSTLYVTDSSVPIVEFVTVLNLNHFIPTVHNNQLINPIPRLLQLKAFL